MEDRANPQVEALGRILPFPSKGRAARGGRRALASGQDANPFNRWLAPVWWLMAWTLAAMRVHAAASQHEVFGFEASLAFLVAAVLPLMRATAISQFARVVARGAVQRLRRRPVREHDPEPVGASKTA